MKLLCTSSLFLILVTIIGCSYVQIDQEYEIRTYNSLFNSLFDSLHILNYQYPVLIPPMPLVNEKGEYIGYDTNEYEAIKKEHELKLSRFNIDTMVFTLALWDTLISAPHDITDLSFPYRDSFYLSVLHALDSMKYHSKPSVYLDIDKLTIPSHFRFKYSSEFPPRIEIWEHEYNFHFAGAMLLSRIYFNKSQTNGVFYCSYMCGRLCGQGYLVIISKQTDKWIIEKMDMLWIS